MVVTRKFLTPDTLEEVTRIAAENDVTIHAGGTDLLPRWSRGLADRPRILVGLRRVESLHGVTHSNGTVRIGACVLISELESNPIIRRYAPVLAKAAGCVACQQIRNRATIGGNLCNASPAADTAVPLMLLDAVVELASNGSGGVVTREVALTEFFRGPGATAVERGEVLTHITFKPLPEGTFTAWEKFGTRPAMEIAVASVGVAITFEKGKIVRARVGYGSVAPIPLRGLRAEAELVGDSMSTDVIARCESAARNEIHPITDVRAGEAYRREVVGVMLRRMLEDAADVQQG